MERISEVLKEKLLSNYKKNGGKLKSCYTVEISKNEKMPHEIELEKKKKAIKDLIYR